jgi:hypothetical protein
MMIASTPEEIIARMSLIWPAVSVARWAIFSESTLPLARLRLERAELAFAPAVTDERVREAQRSRPGLGRLARCRRDRHAHR